MRAETSNEPVRVLFVDHTAKLGGGEIALRNLLNALDRKRVAATVVLCGEGPLIDQLISNNHSVRVFPLPSHVAETRKDSLGWSSLIRLKEIGSSLAFVWGLSRYIRASKFDVVHTNSLKAHILGGIAARLAGRPVIWHMRDRIASDYLPRSVVRFVRTLSRLIPEFLIANSAATMETILPNGSAAPLASCRFRVIHDGCVLSKRLEHNRDDGTRRIGMLGRISPWKGQHIFIHAAALVVERFPEVQFEIIGAPLFSETAYEEDLHRTVASLHLERNLKFRGFVSDVPTAIARLEIVVHASTIGEPFGQVVIESMAAGKPVIATRAGAIPEIVLDNETGLLVPVEDEHALADAMVKLLLNPAQAAQMGETGRERVRSHFTIDQHARAVEQVYTDVVRRTRTHSGSQRRLPREPESAIFPDQCESN